MKKSMRILLHSGYWFLYLALLCFIFLCLSVGPHLKPAMIIHNAALSAMLVISTILPAVFGFYTHYYLLFDKYLTRKKTGMLVLTSVLSSMIAGVLTAALLQLLHYLGVGAGITNDGMGSAIPITAIMMTIALLNGMTGLVMKGFISWYGDIKTKEDLLQQQHATELALVKSQIDPHFLFNTINNIDVLIETDATRASAYLNRLSHMMRFMLYENKASLIPIQQEVDYIREYIALQQLRVDNPENVWFSYTNEDSDLQIPAMLFIPFVENAFKHNHDRKTSGAIQIKLQAGSKEIVFTCQNSCSEQPQRSQAYGGVGNNIIKRRLELLYGSRHQLRIQQAAGTYLVQLNIQSA